jgi:hypothetical protein
MKFTISRETPAQTKGYGTIPHDKRGIITGKRPNMPERLGGDMTNEQFMKANNLKTKRQASKIRNRRIPMPVAG